LNQIAGIPDETYRSKNQAKTMSKFINLASMLLELKFNSLFFWATRY